MSASKITKVVDQDQHNIRLDKFLSEIAEIGSRSRAQVLIEKKNVLVNKKNEKNSYIVKQKDFVEVEIPEDENLNQDLLPLNLNLDVVFEDKDLIVINKPAGLVVHPAAGHAQDTLVNALLHHTNDLSMKFGEKRPGIVHRIDRDTSGLLVVAKNDFSHEKLAQQFKQKSIHRVYFAVVTGEVKNPKGTIQSYLHRHPKNRKKYCSARDNKNKIIVTPNLEIENTKWSVTHYTRLSINKKLSYLRLQLETGRTHQIRIHLSEMGHPIYGDETYGFKHKVSSVHFNRFLLHAAELGFTHPRTNKLMNFSASWPTEEKKFIESTFNV